MSSSSTLRPTASAGKDEPEVERRGRETVEDEQGLVPLRPARSHVHGEGLVAVEHPVAAAALPVRYRLRPPSVIRRHGPSLSESRPFGYEADSTLN